MKEQIRLMPASSGIFRHLQASMLTTRWSDIIGRPLRSPITSGIPRNRRSVILLLRASRVRAHSSLIYFHVLSKNMNKSPPNSQPASAPPIPRSSFAPSLRGPLAGGRQITRNRASYSCHTCRRRKVKCDKVDGDCVNAEAPVIG